MWAMGVANYGHVFVHYAVLTSHKTAIFITCTLYTELGLARILVVYFETERALLVIPTRRSSSTLVCWAVWFFLGKCKLNEGTGVSLKSAEPVF